MIVEKLCLIEYSHPTPGFDVFLENYLKDESSKKVGDPKEWRHKQKKRPWN